MVPKFQQGATILGTTPMFFFSSPILQGSSVKPCDRNRVAASSRGLAGEALILQGDLVKPCGQNRVRMLGFCLLWAVGICLLCLAHCLGLAFCPAPMASWSFVFSVLSNSTESYHSLRVHGRKTVCATSIAHASHESSCDCVCAQT